MSENTILESDHHRHIHRARQIGNYFTFFSWYIWIMPGNSDSTKRNCALFLQDIINLTNLDNSNSEVIDGKMFSECTTSFLQNSVASWKEDDQFKYLSGLKSLGFVEIIQHGPTRSRWIHINHHKIEEALDGYFDFIGKDGKRYRTIEDTSLRDFPERGIQFRKIESPGSGKFRNAVPENRGVNKEQVNKEKEKKGNTRHPLLNSIDSESKEAQAEQPKPALGSKEETNGQVPHSGEKLRYGYTNVQKREPSPLAWKTVEAFRQSRDHHKARLLLNGYSVPLREWAEEADNRLSELAESWNKTKQECSQLVIFHIKGHFKWSKVDKHEPLKGTFTFPGFMDRLEEIIAAHDRRIQDGREEEMEVDSHIVEIPNGDGTFRKKVVRG